MGLAIRQRNLPSEWFAEAERDPAAVLTALHLIDLQDREAQRQIEEVDKPK